MIFKIDKQAFVTGIKAVAGAIKDKNTITALNYVKAEIEGNTLTLTGFDLEIGIKTSVEIENNSSEKITFLFDKKIVDLLVKLDNGEVEVTISDDEIVIKQGKSRNKRALVSAIEYPALPEISNAQVEFEMSHSELKEMIDGTIFSVSINESRPILTGELFDIENGNFNLVAIDGFRLSIRNTTLPNDITAKFVVPAKTLREISKLTTKDDGVIKIAKTSKHALFEYNGITIISRLLDGEYHNYKTAIPQGSKTVVTVKTSELIKALDRCMLVTNDKFRSPTKFVFEWDNINLTCNSPVGNVDEDVEADFSGETLEIGFNTKFFIEALKNCDCDRVKISLNAPTTPASITATENSNFTYIVLPVRLKG